MNLLDMLSISLHYFCRKWIGATNENSNFDLVVYRVNWAISVIVPHFFFQFQISDQPYRQTCRLNHQSSPSNLTPAQTTTSEYHNRSPSDPTTKSDHQIRPPPSNQTTRSDQVTPPDHRSPSLTLQLPSSTVYPTFWNGTGQVHSLGVGSRGVYKALDEPCKAYFPHTFGLKFPEFFRLNLTVVRLASGFPGLVRASPSLFHKLGSFAGVRSAIRVRLLGIG